MRAFPVVALLVALVAPAVALTKPQARKQCRREVPACVADLLAHPPPKGPIRARRIEAAVGYQRALGRLVIEVRADGSVRVALTVLDDGADTDDFFVCYSEMHLVQAGRQMQFCAVNEPDDTCCRATPGVCDEYSEGVTAEMILDAFPSWFDVNQPFGLDWTERTFDVP